MAVSPQSVRLPEHAPHCEIGCAANVAKRVGVDFPRHVAGSQWLAHLRREPGDIPQPMLDRTHLTFGGTARAGPPLAGITDGTVHEPPVARSELPEVLRDDLARGGSLLFLEDRGCPWLHSAGPGLLPHTVTPDGVDAAGVWQLIEGHSWWAGRYPMAEADLLAAAYPDPDPHHVAGRVLSLRLALTPERRAALDALDRLRDSVRAYLTGGDGRLDTPAGTLVWTDGQAAVAELLDRLRGWEYLCALAADDGAGVEQGIDIAVGRYLFLGLADELAYTSYARTGARRLTRRLGALADIGDEHLPDVVWQRAWRTPSGSTGRCARSTFDALLHDIDAAGVADAACARRLAEVL
uniref:LmbD protein n=1 Tax=Streptomyces lincolnensis TaxID=1915 RepID=Q54357_STRLN|nr:lmbD [Streptomyces lincolnensis]